MSPCLISVATVIALFVGLASAATGQSYQIVDTYQGPTFFDKFRFFESVVTSDSNTIDPTGGFVRYRNQADATSMGLVTHNNDGSVTIGVDSTTVLSSDGPLGRSSVRIESIPEYTNGLFIFDMAHLPKPVSGIWPAIWTYGDNWPKNGEIDVYENWNDNFAFNRQTLQTAGSSTCTISGTNMTAKFETHNCDTYYSSDTQSKSQGCSADDYGAGAWGSENGGMYVLEISKSYIRMWHFTTIPTDISSGNPNPAGWGTPTFSSAGGTGSCNITSNFGPQKIVLNIDFCGVAGDSWAWKQTSAYTQGGKTSCWNYVAKNPTAFADVFFKINSVKLNRVNLSFDRQVNFLQSFDHINLQTFDHVNLLTSFD